MATTINNHSNNITDFKEDHSMKTNNMNTRDTLTLNTLLPGGGFYGGEQTDVLPGGGFHGDEQMDVLPGGCIHGTCQTEILPDDGMFECEESAPSESLYDSLVKRGYISDTAEPAALRDEHSWPKGEFGVDWFFV